MKKIILLINLLYCLSMHAATGDKFKYNEIYFIITSEVNKTCSTTKYDASDSEIPSYEISGNLVIPSKVTGPRGVYTVTGIDRNSFYFNECISSVTIPNTVTEIGTSAFEKCLGLKNIKLPSSITSIKNSAFAECAMSSIEIPSSVEYIGIQAFRRCGNLEEVIVNDSRNELRLGNEVFIESPVKHIYFGRNWRYDTNSACRLAIKSNSLEVTLGKLVNKISGGAFAEYKGSLSIDIPDHIRSIESHAFMDCSGLTSLRLPATIDSIKLCTFYRCTNLQTINIPNSVKIIDQLAFSGCSSLKTITIPNSVKIIDRSAFSGCSSLKTITIPNSVESIEYQAFDECTNLKQLIIEDGDTKIELSEIKTIEDIYFGREWKYCVSRGLKTVRIGDRVKKIPESAFLGCKELSNIPIPNTVESIGGSAFSGCESLTSINLPPSLDSIKNGLFSYSGITSITIPKSVVSIGDGAFYGCKSLETVTIPKSVKTIENNAFGKCPAIRTIYNERRTPVKCYPGFETMNFIAVTLYIPTGTISSYKQTAPWSSFEKIREYRFETMLAQTGISLHIGESKTLTLSEPDSYSNLVWTSSNPAIASVDSNGKVTAKSVGRVEITVSGIDIDSGDPMSDKCMVYAEEARYTLSYTFDDATSTATVTSISGTENMLNCLDIVVPEYVEHEGRRYRVTAIGDAAFYYCRALTSLTLPVSVTSIGLSAFASCSYMTSLTMGDLVTSIGDTAFQFCRSLKSLRLSKSLKEIGKIAFQGAGLEKVYYGADDPVSVSSDIFDGERYTNTTLYVKASSLDKIRSTMPWSLFEKIETYDFRDITLDNTSLSMRPGESLTLNVINNSGSTDLKWISTNPEVATVDGNGRVTTYAGGTTKIIVTATDPENNTTVGAFCNITVIALNYAYDQSSLTATVTGISDIKNGDPVDIVIPEYVEHEGQQYKVTAIGDNAFNRCDKLNSVTISNTVISIGRWAFEYCTGLTSVIIGNSVTTLNSRAFSRCSNLTSLTLPNSVTTINMNVFEYCSSLTSVTLSNSLNYIGNMAFYKCTGLKSVNIPNSVEIIGPSAFSGCENLTSVTIPGSVNIIGTDAFKDCKSLTSVTLPNSVTEIMAFTFMNCSSLVSVDLGDSVSSIGSVAFYGCSSLSTITIPGTVNTIGDQAFFDCRNLEKVYYGADEPITAPENVFSDYSKATLYVKESALEKIKVTTPWCLFGNVETYDFAGIDDLTIDGSGPIDYTMPYDVYDLNGRKVAGTLDGLRAGFYIVRQGARTEKTLVR